ncbi:hypothetical protein GGF43_001607 [Coemansia sp. RSA 2618]|nr:hypothetical protein GGF43_001607 [Coemansia sp. RSA 2618]
MAVIWRTSDNDCDEAGSDVSWDGDSDDGFDGQCDGMSLTATTESTAECSRSGSYRSSKSNSSESSDTSSSSTSTEPSLKWWKRHFKSKSKSQLQDAGTTGMLLRRSTPALATVREAAVLGEESTYGYEMADVKRVHGGALLAQEYSRRKSVCSLASRTVYIWLGAHASAIKRDAIMRVAMEIRDKELMGKAAVVVVDESAASNSARKKFFAQLYLSEHGECLALPKEPSALYSQITPLSRAGDDLDFERALQRRKVMYGFWEAVPPATIIAAGTYVNAAALLKVPAGGAIVLDTWSDVFIWWRNEPCNPAVRRCAINFANMLVKDVSIPPRPQSASVWHETQGSEHVIFKTKFPDWPFVFAATVGAAEVPRQMAPAAGSAPSPMALPIRTSSRSVAVA